MRALSSRTAPVAVLVATAAAFSPALLNGFVNWDDPETLTDNWSYRGLGWRELRWMFTTLHMGHYQPIPWVTFGADYLAWGMNPAGYHLTSILFHVANAAIVYFIALRLIALASVPSSGLRAPSHATRLHLSAAVAAGVFALHPLRVESVAWATERRDVVSGFFYLLAVLWHIDSASAASRRGRIARRFASIGAFAGALLSKSIAATLPAILLVIDTYPLRRLRNDPQTPPSTGARVLALLWEKAPYFALTLASIAVGVHAQSTAGALPGIDEYGIVERAAIAVYGLAFYLWKTIWPLDISPLYPMPPDLDVRSARFLVSGVFVAIVSIAAWVMRRRHPSLLASWIAYALMLTPVLGLVQVWGYIVAARYSYLPGVSLALLAGGGTYRLLRGDEDARAARTESAVVRVRRAPILAPAVIAAALVALAAVTASDTRAWRNGETLWRRALAIDPRNHLAHTNLGGFYALQGKPSEAESEFRRALETDPRLGDALGGLATLALEAGRLDEAEALYERALASQPVHPSVVSNLGVLHMKRGESARAIAAFEQAIAMHPTYADAWRNLGGALEATGDHARAAEALRAAVRLNPEDDDARLLLAASLFRADRRAEALDAARANLERDPRDVYSANIAAWVLATAPESELRDGAEAVRIAAAALQNEADPPAYLLDTYAAALATAGRFEEAVAAARRAVERAVAVGDSAQARLSRERLARFTAREAFRDEATPRAGG